MRFQRPRFTSAHAIALLALFVSLGGTVYAASAISGKAIRKGSIPGNRLKKNGVTGIQVNEGSLATVPSAARAAEATKAGEAAKAAEATRASTAANAGHATSADNATNAGRATNADTAGNAGHAINADHATNADSATNAGHASSADSAGDAGALGGEPPASYQRFCREGTIKGVVRVNENNGNPDPITKFNCSGGGITVSKREPGKYDVNFEGLDNLLSAAVSDISQSVEVDVRGEGAGAFLVTTAAPGGGRVDTDQFTLVVF